MATSCRVKPFAKLGFGGVTSIDISAAGVTVKLVEPDTPFKVAMIVAVPDRTVATVPPAPIQAMAGLLELQATCAERLRFEPSLMMPVAVNWLVSPIATLLSGGPTSIELTCVSCAPLECDDPQPESSPRAPITISVASRASPARDASASLGTRSEVIH